MSELLLQAIVEKLEALEIALLKKDNTGKDEVVSETLANEIKSLRVEIKILLDHSKINGTRLSELIENMNVYSKKWAQPLQNNIEHRHHIHKGIWFSVALLILSLILSWGWINSYKSKEAFESNDIKYRSLKVAGNTSLLKLLYHTDSLYNINGDSFKSRVEVEEQRLLEQAQLLHLAGEKEKEARKLKEKAGKRN
jgi:hypothetical protein